jgi:hypothetical protein
VHRDGIAIGVGRHNPVAVLVITTNERSELQIGICRDAKDLACSCTKA